MHLHSSRPPGLLMGRPGGPRPTASRHGLRRGAQTGCAHVASRTHLRPLAQQAHLGLSEALVSEHRASCGLQFQAAPAACVASPGPQAAASPGLGRRALLSASTAAVLAAAGGAPPAMALKALTLPDGSEVQAYEHGLSLSIVALRGAVPSQWVVDFRQCLGKYAGFSLDQRPQISEIYSELGAPGKKPRSAAQADVVSLGDAWLAGAIRQGWLQPIPSAETYRWWHRLPRRWQQLVQRDGGTGVPAAGAPIWGCPFRWGASLVAYRPDKLVGRGGRPVLDWEDLLQPKLRGRVAYPESPREFIGIALKSLGLSLNATAADMARVRLTRGQVKDRVQAFRRQARLFSDRDHVRALSAGDAWAVVGASSDLVPLGERTPSLDVLAPASGTSLWADVWVVPAHAKGGHMMQGPSPILPAWLEFSVVPGRIGSLQGLRTGASPLLLPDAAPAPAAQREACEPGQHHHARRRWPWQHANAAPGAPAAAGEHHHHHQHGQHHQHGDGAGGGQHGGHAAGASSGEDGVGGRHAPDWGLTAEQLKLSNATHFLPPEPVLQRSEFIEPLDADTLLLYKWLLEP